MADILSQKLDALLSQMKEEPGEGTAETDGSEKLNTRLSQQPSSTCIQSNMLLACRSRYASNWGELGFPLLGSWVFKGLSSS